MDWQKQMNLAMDYIENHLGEKIDYDTLAQIVGCSEWEFRRMFSFLAQMSLSEYIRKRRLTVAIPDIKKGNKLIDVALQYGYKSQAAFSRAFKQEHGITPTMAQRPESVLQPFQAFTFKLVLKENEIMMKEEGRRKHIMGSRDAGVALSIALDPGAIHSTNEHFWGSVGTELVGGTALPKYGAFVTEEKHQFFKDVDGKSVLEIGCGTGRSLAYLAGKGAGDLWGLDISQEQVDKTAKELAKAGYPVRLVCSPMEEACELPEAYFDYVYSVYGIGWTTDLETTFQRVASYLKPGGSFIFSWSHPIHKCVAPEKDDLIFKRNYFDESWYSVTLDGHVFSLSDRKMSTYINALAKAGLYVEELVEESDEEYLSLRNSAFANKAKMLPVTFVIKARKL